MEELKIGEKINFPDDEWIAIDGFISKLNGIKSGLEALSASYNETEKAMWETIKAFKPETDQFVTILKKKEKQLMILRKNED